MFHNGTQLLNTHLETTIAHKAAHHAMRVSKGSTDGSRQTVTHGTQTTTGTQTTFVVILEVTSCKQLVLTNIRYQNRIIRRQLCYHIHHLAHLQLSLLGMDGGLYHLFAFFLHERFKRVAPCLVIILIDERRNSW